jgi:alpha-beta hydrolase superfamily lysophospholipase
MGEHSLRYARLAEALVQEGYIVYANDHRGHGQTVKDASQLGDYGPEGWRGLIDDQLQLIRRVRVEHDARILLLGHSMGSMVVQHLITEESDLLAGAALSGTTAADVMAAAMAQAASEAADNSDNSESDGGATDLFATFNAAFEPVRTESDWLSRDPDEVDLYVNDPLCGFSVTDDSLASLMQAGVAYSSDAATNAIRKDLPIYLFSGEADPVGLGGVLVTKVAERYRAAGISEVELKLYFEARHEVFNETNRGEVVRDFIVWANRICKDGSVKGVSV